MRSFLLTLLALGLVGCLTESSKELHLAGTTMGTSYSITLVAPPSGFDKANLQDHVDTELDNINQKISTWDRESELSVFNATESTEWSPLSPSTLEIIRTAKRVSKETGGAYDVTLGSISALWGFGPHAADREKAEGQADNQPVKPGFDDILLLMNDVGHQLLLVSTRDPTVRKLTSGLQIDLSSIGKGYAVDRIGEIIESYSITRYLVEIGGEIRTRGRAADGEMWKIGIETPETVQQNVKKGLSVESAHIASSGDYRNYREVDGERVSHLIDGRSGFPISHNLVAVTLLHGSTMMADAWATALMILGYEEASKLAESKGLAAQFTVREGAGFTVHSTSAFDAYSYTEE